MMVWHLVLMKPKADLPPGDRLKLIETFDETVRQIPTVRHVRVGRRIVHGAAYEASAPDAADFMIAIGFDDLDGLEAYLRHPAHEELATRFYEALSSALIYDFDTGGMDKLRELAITRS